MGLFDSNAFFAGFYWGPRRESPRRCAVRLKHFLDALADVDGIFRSWCAVDAHGEGLSSSLGDLEDLIQRRWMRTDIGRRLVDEGGCELMLQTHVAAPGEVTISIGCGASSEWLGNNCVIYLPRAGEAADRILRVAPLIELSKVCVDNWEPDYGIVVSGELAGAVEPKRREETTPRPIEFGWVTYCSSGAYRPPDAIRPPSRVVPVGTRGHIIVAMDERPVASNPAHIRIFSDVLKQIRKSRMVKTP